MSSNPKCKNHSHPCPFSWVRTQHRKSALILVTFPHIPHSQQYYSNITSSLLLHLLRVLMSSSASTGSSHPCHFLISSSQQYYSTHHLFSSSLTQSTHEFEREVQESLSSLVTFSYLSLAIIPLECYEIHNSNINARTQVHPTEQKTKIRKSRLEELQRGHGWFLLLLSPPRTIKT